MRVRLNRKAALLSALIIIGAMALLAFILWLSKALGVNEFQAVSGVGVVLVLWCLLYSALADWVS